MQEDLKEDSKFQSIRKLQRTVKTLNSLKKFIKKDALPNWVERLSKTALDSVQHMYSLIGSDLEPNTIEYEMQEDIRKIKPEDVCKFTSGMQSLLEEVHEKVEEFKEPEAPKEGEDVPMVDEELN